MEHVFSVVDLFAGVGGFSLGFRNANGAEEPFRFDIRLLVDVDPTAAVTFKKNFPQIPFWPKDLEMIGGGDVLEKAKLRAGELDFLIGGPPCQGFSMNGKRWLEDDRNKLMARFVAIAREIRPRCATLENWPS